LGGAEGAIWGRALNQQVRGEHPLRNAEAGKLSQTTSSMVSNSDTIWRTCWREFSLAWKEQERRFGVVQKKKLDIGNVILRVLIDRRILWWLMRFDICKYHACSKDGVSS